MPTENVVPVFELQFIPYLLRRNDGLKQQLSDLVRVANRLGMHDAADYLLDELADHDVRQRDFGKNRRLGRSGET